MKEKIKSFLNERKINFHFEHNSPKHFIVSQWQQTEKSARYVIYRWIIACFYVFSFIYSFATSISRGEFKVHFIYLTNLNLCATMILTTLHAALVTMYYIDYVRIPDQMTLKLKLVWFLSISCTMYSILISMIYWLLLFKKDQSVIDLNNILIHITNSCVLVLDLFVIKHCARISHFIWPLLCGILYLLIFTLFYPLLGGLNRYNMIDFPLSLQKFYSIYVFFRKGQNFIYPILNWKEKPLNALFYACAVLIFGAIIHCILVGCHQIRKKIHAKYCEKYQMVIKSTTNQNLISMDSKNNETFTCILTC